MGLLGRPDDDHVSLAGHTASRDQNSEADVLGVGAELFLRRCTFHFSPAGDSTLPISSVASNTGDSPGFAAELLLSEPGVRPKSSGRKIRSGNGLAIGG